MKKIFEVIIFKYVIVYGWGGEVLSGKNSLQNKYFLISIDNYLLSHFLSAVYITPLSQSVNQIQNRLETWSLT